MKSVRIIGLGLMGTNLGVNLIGKGIKVYGDDINNFAIKRADKLGIDVNKTHDEVDLTILAMPINKIISYLKDNKKLNNTKALLDIGGTKQEICDLMDKLEEDLENGDRKVENWANSVGVKIVNMNFEKNDPFFNINTKEDLEKAKKYIS